MTKAQAEKKRDEALAEARARHDSSPDPDMMFGFGGTTGLPGRLNQAERKARIRSAGPEKPRRRVEVC